MQLKLKFALEDKIKATEENLKLAKLYQESETNYINLLFKLEELNESLMQKTLELKQYKDENEDLKEEILLLKHLIKT